MNSPNSGKPPTPVDVSPEDLRAGKFHLNPDAEAERRARRSDPRAWIALGIGWGFGYWLGVVLESAIPSLHIANLWGVLLGLLAVVVAYGAGVSLIKRVTRQELSLQSWIARGLFGAGCGLISGLWH